MERLTERDAHGNWRIKRFTEILPAHWQACNRLAAIEDALGDEYDLERLRELVEADKTLKEFAEDVARQFGYHGTTADGRPAS